jgi:2'-5' RNA ligase
LFCGFWETNICAKPLEDVLGRKFIAVVPEGLNENLELKQLMGKLKRTINQREQVVRWVAADLWHVTLVFLGEFAPASIEAEQASASLREFLQDWRPAIAGVTLRLQGLGAFPRVEEARVLWIGVQENQEFLDLQRDLQEQLVAAGFALGEREFNPHLTLARFRNMSNVNDLVKLGGRKHFGDYKVGELILFDSVLEGNILKYSPVYRKKL